MIVNSKICANIEFDTDDILTKDNIQNLNLIDEKGYFGDTVTGILMEIKRGIFREIKDIQNSDTPFVSKIWQDYEIVEENGNKATKIKSSIEERSWKMFLPINKVNFNSKNDYFSEMKLDDDWRVKNNDN